MNKKPDNFPFSQEIFEQIERAKILLLDDATWDTEECQEIVTNVSQYLLTPEYDNYLISLHADAGIMLTITNTKVK